MKKIITYIFWLCSVLLVGCNNGDDGLLDIPDTEHFATALVVSPKDTDIPIGFPQQLEADAVLDDGRVVRVTTHEALTWSSSNPDIATVDAKGMVTGRKSGRVVITAKGNNANGSVVSDSSEMTIQEMVISTLRISPQDKVIAKGLVQSYQAEVLMTDGQTFNVTKHPALTWSSSESSVATISNTLDDKGQAKALGLGETVIMAKGQFEGKEYTASTSLGVKNAAVVRLDVTPKQAFIPIGLEIGFSASALLSDGSVQDVTRWVNWSSGDPSSVAVGNSDDDKGLARGLALSSKPVDIHASLQANGQNYTGVAALTVTDATVVALHVLPKEVTLPVGFVQDYRVDAELSDGSVLEVTKNDAISWTTNDSSIATVDNGIHKGRVTANDIGEVSVTATGIVSGQAYTDTVLLKVSAAVVTELEITPTTSRIPVGLSQTFKAIAVLSDGERQDVTRAPTYVLAAV